MKKTDFWTSDALEKIAGGLLGVIAIIAAVAELILSGVDAASIAGTIKDIAGVLIVVALWVAFIKQMPHKPKNTAELLEKAIEDWGNDNAPLIFKAEGYVSAKDSAYTQGFLLLQNPRSFALLSYLNKSSADWIDYAKYGGGKKLTGKFIDLLDYKKMTEDTAKVQFTMEQSHFSKMPEISTIIDDIIKSINTRYKGNDNCIASAKRIGTSYKFILTYKTIETKEDVEEFVNILDYVLSLVKVVA